MSCSRYTLINTGSTVVNFNYQRCEDYLWEYQVDLFPNQTKNIWVVDGTYQIAQFFGPQTVVSSDVSFPPPPTPTPSPTATVTPTPGLSQTPTPSVTPTNTVTPTITPTASVTPTLTVTPTESVTPTPTESATPSPTPTQSVTPSPTQSVTPTVTVTPSITPTNTLTPTPSNFPELFSFSVIHSETSLENACTNSGDATGATIFGVDENFEDNTLFYGCGNPPCPGVNLIGWYTLSGSYVELDSDGVWQAGGICATATPTPTITPTITTTPTITPTITPTVTPTPGYAIYSLGNGVSSSAACLASPTTYYGQPDELDGPSVGETLYTDTLLTTPVSDGFYSNGVRWFEVTGGAGLITSAALC